MRTWLSYAFIGIMWCLFVLGVTRLIELGASTNFAREPSPAPYCC